MPTPPVSNDRRAAQGYTLLRLALAGLLAAHGWARLFADGITPFGGWLDSLGFPFGLGIAWGVTLVEIVGTPLLALRKFVFPLCCVYMAIYATGLVLVHWPAGWFVVGLGRNGMEYSVLLLVCLAAVAWQDAPRRR